MSGLVLDGSLALAWVLPDEGDDLTTDILVRVTRDRAIVPSLWFLEVANVLLMAERRRRITSDHRTRGLAALRELPIEVDGQTTFRAWTDTSNLAAQFGLTVYDASYLEVALRLNLPLASRDRALRAAAEQRSVQLLG